MRTWLAGILTVLLSASAPAQTVTPTAPDKAILSWTNPNRTDWQMELTVTGFWRPTPDLLPLLASSATPYTYPLPAAVGTDPATDRWLCVTGRYKSTVTNLFGQTATGCNQVGTTVIVPPPPPPPPAPTAPSGVSVTLNSDGSLHVAWSATPGVTAYQVQYRSQSATKWTALVNTTTLTQRVPRPSSGTRLVRVCGVADVLGESVVACGKSGGYFAR